MYYCPSGEFLLTSEVLLFSFSKCMKEMKFQLRNITQKKEWREQLTLKVLKDNFTTKKRTNIKYNILGFHGQLDIIKCFSKLVGCGP